MARLRQTAALLLALCVACSSSGATRSGATTPKSGASTDGVARYRLLLRDNPVDPGEAFRCYGRCQAAPTPHDYFDCLSQCPGFDVTLGVPCAKYEVPPVAACLTVRKVRAGKEIDPGLIVLATIGTFLLVVGAVSLCSSSSSQCGYAYSYAPY